MSSQIHILNKEHNEELCHLAALCNTGSEWFRIERSPDFFALSKVLGDTTYFGYFRDGILVGCVGVSKQLRFVQSKMNHVYYLHDLRVHPKYRSTNVFSQLIQAVQAYFEQKTSWMFGTILDQNPYENILTKKLLGKRKIPIKKLGQTYHTGVPLFCTAVKGDSNDIEQVSPIEAWESYLSFTSGLSFAPCEKDIFLSEPGLFLVKKQDGIVLSVCKITDQDHVRKIITGKIPYIYNFINLMYKFRGYRPFPKTGGVFRHGYLAYYAAQAGRDDRRDYITYLYKSTYLSYSYLFMGLTRQEAVTYKHPFISSFSSTSYLYGEYTDDLKLDFHELTLI
ncbi:GNAT family N-acetyltransferase [Shimazuella kribbensis]|uniref:GNAT family N-acetyltransferase n=1 Tax=Shimazuella kribbensis TaxID=139808 RepID=UPI00041E9BD3|nr:GNAT family N-acetyltransferase [Shimazuella kribbensis]